MDRLLRVQSIISKNVSEIIQFELKNPNIGFCTVNEVLLTRDFQIATIYVTFLGAKKPEQNLKELIKCVGYIRHSLSGKMDTRKVPTLRFVLDRTRENQEHLDELLAKEEAQLEKLKNSKKG